MGIVIQKPRLGNQGLHLWLAQGVRLGFSASKTQYDILPAVLLNLEYPWASQGHWAKRTFCPRRYGVALESTHF